MTLRPQPAYSLIFAFIIVTVMMLVAVTTIQNTTDKISYYKDLEGGSEAYLAAQSAAEDGVLAMKNYNAGYTNSAAVPSFSTDYDGDGTDETTSQYQVYGNAQANSTDTSVPFYLPMPGTGTAGTDCSVTDSNHDGDFDNDPLVDDPCNWNKMLYGDSVTIPLYTDDGLGGLLFPYDLSGFNGWSLKVRTPCDTSIADNTDPETCVRYELNDGNSGSSYTYASDDSVILWQLTGSGTVDSTGADYTVSVVPDDTPKSGGSRGTTIRDPDLNTEVYESLINNAAEQSFSDTSGLDKYVVLEAANSAPYTDIYNACMGDTDGDPTTREVTLSSLSLQMDIVTPLKRVTTDASIPYLEWQLTIDSAEPFADYKSVIIGEGYHQGTDHIFYYPYAVTRSTTGESSNVYTLSN